MEEPSNPMSQAGIYPRVVHIGYQPIGAPTNSGLTLASMFEAWPEHLMLQVCLRHHPITTADQSVHIAPGRIAPVDGSIRKLLGSMTPRGAVDGLNNSISRRGRDIPVKDRLRNLATTLNDIGPVVLPSVTKQVVRDYRPDVLHSLLGGVRSMKIALAVSKLADVPILPHFMDDWPANLFRDGQVFGLARYETERLLGEVLDRSPLLATIGSDMAREYEKRYGKECVTIGNSSVSEPPAGLSSVRDEEIVYAGGLHLDRDQVLGAVGGALDSWNSLASTNFELVLYTPAADHQLADRLSRTYESIVHRGSVASSEVPDVLRQSGATLFLESSDPAILEFTRLSVSTKVPQYLAAGRPVLVIGPDRQSSVRALLESGRAVYGGNGSNTSTIQEALSSLVALVRREPEGGLPTVFDRVATQERLRAALVRSVEKRGN